MGYIYKITNLINNKIYIGKTKFSIEHRWKVHLKNSKIEKIKERPLYRAINKYGVNSFSQEVVEECSNEILNEREIYWISFYKSFGNGYNCTVGGDGGSTINDSEIISLYVEKGMSIHKISASTKHCRESISNCLKSNNIQLKNYNIDQQKIIEMYVSGQSVHQIFNVTGHNRVAISKILKNNDIKVINPKAKRAVLQMDLSGNIISEFDSVSAAQKEMKKQGKSSTLNLTGILKCLKGKCEIFYGYKWEYK